MITIDARFNGPRSAANGGVAGGTLAELVDRPATVRFHAPIPLDTPLIAAAPDARGVVVVTAADARVASVRPAGPIAALEDLPVPTRDEVDAAEAEWAEFVRSRHPYPTCFGCGPERAPGDGLGLKPGHVRRLDVHATSWRPSDVGQVPTPLVWAAMDCGSAGPVVAGMGPDEAVVTGELSVEVVRPVPTGDLVVVSRAVERDGPRTVVAAQLVDRSDGKVLAHATSTWFTIPKELAP